MAILTIPTTSDTPFFSQVSQLEGVDYVFVFVYNQRENCYYLSLETVAGDEIVKGLKLVCNVPLLLKTIQGNLALPPGQLFVASSETSDDSPPGLNELGARCELIYFTSDDPSLL